MSSNEEYLDNLLKSMQEKEESVSGEPTDDVSAIFGDEVLETAPISEPVPENPPTNDDLAAMTEDEIADMLNSLNSVQAEEKSEEDLLAEAMKDSAIMEINDLLYKNDRNRSPYGKDNICFHQS